MNLIRFSPGRDVHDEFDRLFDGAFSLLPSTRGTSWLPPVDIHETATGFTLKMDVPGIKPEDLKVNLVDGTLSIEGERTVEKTDDNSRTHRSERITGSFVRRFTLKTPVDPAGIKAAYKDGVLNVTLPRAQEALPRNIRVEAE